MGRATSQFKWTRGGSTGGGVDGRGVSGRPIFQIPETQKYDNSKKTSI